MKEGKGAGGDKLPATAKERELYSVTQGASLMQLKNNNKTF